MSSEHTLTTWRYSPSTGEFEQKSARRHLGAKEVLIKTTHSGLCHTDVHAKDKGCGLGHEGIGEVVKIGSEVTAHRVGDRVGWGWLHSSCSHCPSCVSGYRQYCAEARGFAYGELEQGAFGDYAIREETFVYAIPSNIPSLYAGPLMCAGASVYEALDVAGTKPSDHVGVVGVGGLGHMAVLFARAMGCAVTAIGHDESQKDGAFDLGAQVFRAMTRPSEASQNPSCQHPQRFGIKTLLICASQVPPLDDLLPLLDRQATIIPMTIQSSPLVVPFLPFILPGHRIMASTEASRQNHIRMIQFASVHNIRPWVEEFPMNADGLKQAFAKLESGSMRYRGVLVREEPASI
ncbi:GroES-like protein [Xylariomycetidae sp. FL0641]|nr:GroES-like protein [Xylariomycetidae sp. FL0641]